MSKSHKNNTIIKVAEIMIALIVFNCVLVTDRI